MKPIIVFLAFFLIAAPAIGQTDDSDAPLFKNEAKLVVTDLLKGSYMFGYERAIGKHMGVALNFGYKSKDGLLKLSGLDTDFIKTDELTYDGFKIVPEFRYYIQEKTNGMLTGFYFGAYVTIVQNKATLEGIYTNENGTFPFQYDATVNTNSVGLMVGYKLKLSKRFNLDFLIAGPGAGSYRLKLKEVVAAPPEFWFDLNEALELISLADLINADFDFSPSNNSDSLILPSFRYAITLGYSF
jgi:hypothetical protein